MTARLTPADRELLKGKNFAHFVTLNEDGSPHSAPLWIDVDDNGRILVNTAAGRRKDRNVRRDRRVALSISPHDDPLQLALRPGHRGGDRGRARARWRISASSPCATTTSLGRPWRGRCA